MKVLVQRSKNSKVEVNGKCVGKINEGLVIFVGFKVGDTIKEINYCINKLLNLRIFNDHKGIMNKSILNTKKSILSISQFTLYAETKKGNRPSYINAMPGNDAKELYTIFNNELRKEIKVEEGVFGADMQVTITNDGPVTIMIESK